MKKRFAIILCGGSGTRLWPLSRMQMPKQFLKLTGETSLFQQTIKRVQQIIPNEQIYIVSHQQYQFEIHKQLGPDASVLTKNLILEPLARNTLPAIALANQMIYRQDSDAVIGVFPSDHLIPDNEAFAQAWRDAEKSAEAGYLTVFGIKPHEAHSGYGYIEIGDSIRMDNAVNTIHRVTQFVEKPNLELAEQYVKAGYLWNSGMYAFTAHLFLELMHQYQPELSQLIASMNKTPTESSYEELPNLSIDYGLAEKVDNIAVITYSSAWSDLGSFKSIHDATKNISNNKNTVHGEVINHDTKNCLLWSDHGLVATLGISDLTVVKTDDVTMVCPINRTEDLKLLANELSHQYPELIEIHNLVSRPWGSYKILHSDIHHKIKQIEINPGASLSLQKHQYRSEHWVIVKGVATVTKGNSTFILNENESTFISIGEIHRLKNNTKELLVIIEVQTGLSADEKDIIRLEDQYERCGI